MTVSASSLSERDAFFFSGVGAVPALIVGETAAWSLSRPFLRCVGELLSSARSSTGRLADFVVEQQWRCLPSIPRNDNMRGGSRARVLSPIRDVRGRWHVPAGRYLCQLAGGCARKGEGDRRPGKTRVNALYLWGGTFLRYAGSHGFRHCGRYGKPTV